MYPITKLTHPRSFAQLPPAKSPSSHGRAVSAGFTQAQTPPPCQDTTQVSKDWRARTDWAAKTQQTLEELSQSFPHVTFVLSADTQTSSLEDSAASLGGGTYLVISEAFLAQMGIDEASYNKGKSTLAQILSQLCAPDSTSDSTSDSGKEPFGKGAFLTDTTLTFYTVEQEATPLPQPPPDYSFSGSTTSQDSAATAPNHRAPKVSYQTGATYAKLAGAKSKLQVTSVMGEARRTLGALHLSATYASESERPQARAAIASLNKLLLRSGQKLRRLNSEELLRFKQKRALAQEREEEALRLQLERQRRKAARTSLDGALVSEGASEDLHHAWRFHSHGYEESGWIAPPAPLPAASVPLPSLPSLSSFGTSGATLGGLTVTLAPSVPLAL